MYPHGIKATYRPQLAESTDAKLWSRAGRLKILVEDCELQSAGFLDVVPDNLNPSTIIYIMSNIKI